MNERNPCTVSGREQVDNTAIRCGLAVIFPWDHIYPRMVVERGQITVLEGERFKPDYCKASNTRFQQFKSSQIKRVIMFILVLRAICFPFERRCFYSWSLLLSCCRFPEPSLASWVANSFCLCFVGSPWKETPYLSHHLCVAYYTWWDNILWSM